MRQNERGAAHPWGENLRIKAKEKENRYGGKISCRTLQLKVIKMEQAITIDIWKANNFQNYFEPVISTFQRAIKLKSFILKAVLHPVTQTMWRIIRRESIFAKQKTMKIPFFMCSLTTWQAAQYFTSPRHFARTKRLYIIHNIIRFTSSPSSSNCVVINNYTFTTVLVRDTGDVNMGKARRIIFKRECTPNTR